MNTRRNIIRLSVLLVAVVLLLTLCACGGAQQYDGVFDSYEHTGSLPSAFSRDSQNRPQSMREFYEKLAEYGASATGRARIIRSGGDAVMADCPFADLEKGAAVRVQQNSDGSWVVVSVLD